MPYFQKVDYAEKVAQAQLDIGAALEGEARRKAAAGVNTGDDLDSGDFALTSTDVEFFLTVSPKIEWVARVMSWINLVTCGIRCFAFMHSEMPIIVRRALEDTEEEEEEADILDAPQEEEKEEETDIVFVEHVGGKVNKSLAKKKAESEDAEETPKRHSQAWRCFVAGVMSPAIEYEVAFTLFPMLAVLTDEPLFSIYALFEICSWKGSKTVIDASNNFWKVF